jgi:hypothetical protein
LFPNPLLSLKRKKRILLKKRSLPKKRKKETLPHRERPVTKRICPKRSIF